MEHRLFTYYLLYHLIEIKRKQHVNYHIIIEYQNKHSTVFRSIYLHIQTHTRMILQREETNVRLIGRTEGDLL